MATIMTIETDSPHAFAELPLLIWLSPAFPVGSFAYSHGLEWAIEAGDIDSATSLERWIGDLLEHGGPRNDAVVLVAAWRATLEGDWPALIAANELALALAGSRERHLETSGQGSAFLAATSAAWPLLRIEAATSALGPAVAYPVAVGLTAAAHNIGLAASVASYLAAAVSNLVSAAVRLGAIGQTDGQRVIATSLASVHATSRQSADWTLDDVGGAAFRSDIAALRHETQYTRLFRS